jgi:hypothetical protein
MKQIFTNESYVLAMNSRNCLEAAGIAVEVRNEFASGAAVGGQSIWPELWVDAADYERALKVLESVPASDNLKDWLCPACKEANPGNFSICWKCQASA